MNKTQYEITRRQAEMFRQAITQMEGCDPSAGMNPDPEVNRIINKAMLDGLRSQLADLKVEIERYELSEGLK